MNAWMLGCFAGLILGWYGHERWAEWRNRRQADRVWRAVLVARARERAERARVEKASDAAGRRGGRRFDMPPADLQRQLLVYAACCGVITAAVSPAPGA